MNYRNQPSNCGSQNQNTMQRGNMRAPQTVPYGVMSGANVPVRGRETCSVVIVSEKADCVQPVVSDVLSEMPLAMAYVPWQKFQNLYNEADAFKNGTIFKELDFEFCKRRCN